MRFIVTLDHIFKIILTLSENVNSLAKDNFTQYRFVEARNSLYNYDRVSICETSLNDSVELPEIMIDYRFVLANNPVNTSWTFLQKFSSCQSPK